MPTPGELILSKDPIEINAGRATQKMTVTNTGDRAAQIGSHFHFFEANRALDFDRARTLGWRLNIPAGTAVRFEPGDSREVELVEIGGAKRVIGFNGLTMGSVNAKWNRKQSLERARDLGFTGVDTDAWKEEK